MAAPDKDQEALDKELIRLLRVDDNRDIASVKAILKAGANPNASIRKGLTPLHYACWRRWLEAAEMLLDHKANLDARDDAGYSCVHMAAEQSSFNEVLEWLLENGADPDGGVKAQYKEADAEVADGFEDLAIHIAPHPLFLALRDGRTGCLEAVKMLLNAGAHVNSAAATYAVNGSATLLGTAVECQNPDLVTLLLSHGVRVDPRDRDGKTPLMTAASYLGDAGLKNSQGSQHSSPAAAMASCEEEEFAEGYRMLSNPAYQCMVALLDAGADVNAVSKEVTSGGGGRRTPLHYAVISGSVAGSEYLIQKGADVNPWKSRCGQAKHQRVMGNGIDGPTPLHFAIIRHNVPMARMLLSCGADPNAIGGLVGTPLHLATGMDASTGPGDEGRDEMIQLLLVYKADPNLDVICDMRAASGAAVALEAVDNNYQRLTTLRSPFAEYMRAAAPGEEVRHDTVAKFLQAGAKVILKSQFRDNRGVLNASGKLRSKEGMKTFNLLANCCQPADIDTESIKRGLAANRMTEAHGDILIVAAASSRTLEQLARLAFRDAVVFHYGKKESLNFIQSASKGECLLESVVAHLPLCKQLADYVLFIDP